MSQRTLGDYAVMGTEWNLSAGALCGTSRSDERQQAGIAMAERRRPVIVHGIREQPDRASW